MLHNEVSQGFYCLWLYLRNGGVFLEVQKKGMDLGIVFTTDYSFSKHIYSGGYVYVYYPTILDVCLLVWSLCNLEGKFMACFIYDIVIWVVDFAIFGRFGFYAPSTNLRDELINNTSWIQFGRSIHRFVVA